MHPSIELRRQHTIRHGAGISKLQLGTARRPLLRGDRKGRVHLPALECRGVIRRAQRGDVELQAGGCLRQ